jgi:hypothetical protein
MSPIGWRKAFVLCSLALGSAMPLACSLDTQGQLSPDASMGGTGGIEGGVDVDTPDIDIPDECPWYKKMCPPPPEPGQCVTSEDPDYGCGLDTCAPCGSVAHTQYGCSNNNCVVDACDPGFYSCNGDPRDGCERDIWSLDDCPEPGGLPQSACGHPCAPAKAIAASCDQGKCTVVKCEDLFADCNSNPDDGCEVDLRDVYNCGGCGTICEVTAPATPTCAAGICRPDICPEGLADCDSNPATCETDITTVDNCGSCGLKCSGPNVKTWTCALVGNERKCQVVECNPGWGNCDGDHANGCEVDLRSSVGNCGQCGAACSELNTQGVACASGQCVPTCVNGFADCNPGTANDGCETNTRTPANCGGCGVECAPPHANGNCSTGVCGIGSCLAGWDDCNNNPADGCETPLNTLANCGGCGVVCDIPNAAESCSTGVCQSAGCATGYADCTSAPGCETNILTTTAHCGGCNKACSTDHVPSPVCTAGSCTGACQAGWGDCNNNKLTDGCETSLATTSNCGTCGTQCTGLYAIWACTTSTCVVSSCEPGRDNCDGNNANGCETNTNTSTTHCGGCTKTCSSNHVPSTLCTNGVCSGACEGGWGDCNANKLTDGCETSTTTTTNCGTCGNACSSVNGTPACNDSTCTISCASGYGDCTSAAGCETNTNTSTSHCGACAQACSSNHVPTPLCTGGACSGICEAGWSDCNSNKLTDGCETNTATNATSCGTCGYICANHIPPNMSFGACTSGTCDYTCNTNWTDCDNSQSNGCECPTSVSFECVNNTCRCKNNPSCGTGGTCNASGLCVCGSNTCAIGQTCVSADTCG